jgi:hypothetical protein
MRKVEISGQVDGFDLQWNIDNNTNTAELVMVTN